MKENEKKAKLAALKGAHSMATKAMKDGLSKAQKSSPALKKHVKEMSDESGIDFEEDSKDVVDPTHHGNVVGRHVSDEEEDCSPSDSTYNIEEIDSRLRGLIAQKAKIKKGVK